MDLRPLIEKKRLGLRLTGKEIRSLVAAVVDGSASDPQLSAWLMAVVLQGMSEEETVALTREMAGHGERLPRDPKRRRIGKHSTGGVGDKTSFLVGPLAASFGLQVPLMAGRGLGHTGGTIDKLSGIAGLKTRLGKAEVARTLSRNGFCIFEQSIALAPADRRLYALRDASGTVASPALITASILSKKIVENLDGLILDVKFGRGALFPTANEARKAAGLLLRVAKKLGLKTAAVLSAMDQPLGQSVGNHLEILESLECLRGRGPQDLTELSLRLVREMLVLAGRRAVPSLADLRNKLASGALENHFFQWVKGQRGSWKESKGLAPGTKLKLWKSPGDGFVAQLDAKELGLAAMALGAGRRHREDSIDPDVGLILRVKVGEHLRRGQVLAEIIYRDERRLKTAWSHLQKSLSLSRSKPRQRPLVKAVLKNYG